MLTHEHLTARIIKAAFYVHNVLGPGHLEHVYQNALVIVLRREGLQVRTEVNVPVDFEGVNVGRCESDMIVEHVVVVENKATLGIMPGHEVRLGAYLNCSGFQLGLLLNFGPTRVEVKRVERTREERATG